MGFRINTNVSSLKAQRSLKNTNKESQEALSKMSSGKRITKPPELFILS